MATKAPKGKVLAPEGWDFAAARRVFSTEILKGDPHVSVSSASPTTTASAHFSSTRTASAERVEAMVKRLRKVRSKKPQRRIDDFVKARAPAASPHFASAPAPPVAPTAPRLARRRRRDVHRQAASTRARFCPWQGRPRPQARPSARRRPLASSSSDDESSGERTAPTRTRPRETRHNGRRGVVGAAVELVGLSGRGIQRAPRRSRTRRRRPPRRAGARRLVTVGDRHAACPAAAGTRPQRRRRETSEEES